MEVSESFCMFLPSPLPSRSLGSPSSRVQIPFLNISVTVLLIYGPPSANRWFYFSLLTEVPFTVFSCSRLPWLVLQYMPNRSRESGPPCLLDLQGKGSIFPLIMVFTVGSSQMFLLCRGNILGYRFCWWSLSGMSAELRQIHLLYFLRGSCGFHPSSHECGLSRWLTRVCEELIASGQSPLGHGV